MARRAKAPKASSSRKKSVQIELKDFQYPKEASTYWTFYGGTCLIFLVVGLLGYFAGPKKPDSNVGYWQWIYVALYPVACVLFVNWISAKPRKLQIKKAGQRAKVAANNYPDLYRTLTEASRILGISPVPDMYVLEEKVPYLYGIPGGHGTILLSSAMQKALSGSELAAMLAHELGHLKGKHLRMDLALTWLQSANALWKVVLLPITLMSALLRGWCDMIDFTADRAAVLVIGNPALLNAALLKLSVALDPQAQITSEELNAYLSSAGNVETDSKQMARYFKVGQFIATQPNLKERIEVVAGFANTEQGKTCIEKLREMRGGLPATPES